MNALTRCAGVMTPLFALRQNLDYGIGDLGALKKLIDWCHYCGLKFIMLLPVNACGKDYSPYNAISSVALEPLYLDITDVELFGSMRFQTPIQHPDCSGSQAAFVDYERVFEIKHAFLYECFRSFSGNSHFKNFVSRNKRWLEGFALFLALSERFNTTDYANWPANCRNFTDAARLVDPELKERINYHKFCQWLCDSAWRSIKRYAQKRKVLLIGDLPFSISRQSADVWQHPERFSEKWNAGAPPEPSFQDDEFVKRWGQNWGLPLYDWESQESKGHPWWKQRLELISRYFHGYRLDHALGYFRVYAFPWNPLLNSEYVSKSPDDVLAEGGELPRFFPMPDDTEENKAVNFRHGQKFFQLLKPLRPRLLVVAEDLGVVPDYVRPYLEQIHVPGMKIPHFERLQPDLRYLPVEEYPACSLATWATHDHLPLAAMWQKWQQNRHHSGADEWEIHCFLNFVKCYQDRREPELPDDLHLAAVSQISTSQSKLLCLQLTDWFKLSIRYNQPGLQSHKNWSARLPFTVESLHTDQNLVQKTLDIVDILHKTHRVGAAKKLSNSAR